MRDALVNRNAREPTISEIADELKISREEVVFALDAIQEPVSLFDPIYIMDQVKSERDQDSYWVEGIAIKEALHRLSERERHILNLRFFSGKTQMEVAEEIGISQAQVSRLEKAALTHMRKLIAPRGQSND